MDQQTFELPDESSAAFSTTISHLYRGEMNRLTVWRQRLDITSNWGGPIRALRAVPETPPGFDFLLVPVGRHSPKDCPMIRCINLLNRKELLP